MKLASSRRPVLCILTVTLDNVAFIKSLVLAAIIQKLKPTDSFLHRMVVVRCGAQELFMHLTGR